MGFVLVFVHGTCFLVLMVSGLVHIFIKVCLSSWLGSFASVFSPKPFELVSLLFCNQPLVHQYVAQSLHLPTFHMTPGTQRQDAAPLSASDISFSHCAVIYC